MVREALVPSSPMKALRFPLLALALSGAATASAATARTPAAPSAAAAAPHASMVLPFIDGDYAKAIAEARARKVPLFVEAWAPW